MRTLFLVLILLSFSNDMATGNLIRAKKHYLTVNQLLINAAEKGTVAVVEELLKHSLQTNAIRRALNSAKTSQKAMKRDKEIIIGLLQTAAVKSIKQQQSQ